MQSAAYSLSSPCSIPSLKPRKFCSRAGFQPIRVSSSFAAPERHEHSVSLPNRSWRLSSSSSLPLRAWNLVPSDSKPDRFEVRAKAAESAGEGEKSGSLVLKVFHYPVTISAVQFAVGTIIVSLMWTFNLYKRPKVSGEQLVAIVPLALVHILGNLFTNMSLGKVAVSFTHTIKAMEPFFSVVLSAMFLGEESLDNITLFSIITIMSFILLAPVAIFVEGIKFTPAYMQSAGLNVKEVVVRSLLAALSFHAYQQVSYMILQRVSPVTHSVGNCVKRVVVIVSSVIFFKTPVSLINSLGTGIALAGVFLYSRVKSIKPKAKAA
ncbi:hypothetical protein GOBAR_AA33095 [Gossypium barbadense]|uniref:Sugar phosphate transporter domain-containing protein n=1 Tax=Gossypium barbadense TaxID=3634 RepID=A0A2P5W924_GOSBA|nr:hypothetical protein GOBAR_AA33095 [Gossypium barbadense]